MAEGTSATGVGPTTETPGTILDARELSIKDVAEVLEMLGTVVDWYSLGTYLKLAADTLGAIEKENLTIKLRLIKMLEQWLRNGQCCSWRKLVEALYLMGEIAVAEIIRRKYLSVTTTVLPKFLQDHDAYTTTPEVRTEIVHKNLQRVISKFSSLVMRLRKRFDALKVDPVDLRTFLITYGCSFNRTDFTAAISHLNILSLLFDSISHHILWDYLNFHLAGLLIEEFAQNDKICVDLLEDYQRDFTGYLLTTEIVHHIAAEKEAGTAKPENIPSEELCSKLTVKLDIDVTTHSLKYVEEVWKMLKKLLKHSQLPKHTLLLHEIAQSSLKIVWLFPKSKVAKVVDAVQVLQNTRDLQLKRIVSITIDIFQADLTKMDTGLHIIKSDKEVMSEGERDFMASQLDGTNVVERGTDLHYKAAEKEAETERYAMAEHQALEKLNDQLSCAVCLEDYTDPKVLACLHAFCKKCLERLVVQDAGNRIVRCPNCRGTTQLPREGIAQLQSAFYIHHLFDVRNVLQKVSTTDKTKCDTCREGDAMGYCRDCGGFVCEACIKVHKMWKEFVEHEIVSLENIEQRATNLVPLKKVVMTCSRHPDEILKVYCETCDELICLDCTIMAHRDHQYNLVKSCFQKHKDIIVKSLQPIKLNLGIVSRAITELKPQSNRLTAQGEQTNEKIRGLHNLLEARKQELTTQVDDFVKLTCKRLETQCEEFELTQIQLKSCVEVVEESLRTGTQEEVLSMKKQVIERAEQMTRDFDPAQFQLKPELKLYFQHEELAGACKAFGEMCLTPLCIPQCYATGPGLKEATVNQETKFSVYTLAEDGEKCLDANAVITGELVSEEDGSVVKCEVRKKEENRYELRYKLQCKGRFQLLVKVNGFHIKDSPFHVTQVKTILLNSPWHLAYSEVNGIVVAENSANCVSVFDREGQKLLTFGNQGSDKMKLIEPRGIAVLSDNTILVAANHCVKKFRMDGTFIASVGSQGNGKLQFNYPYEVAADERGSRMYVCDTNNHRIQVFNFDLSYYTSFGSRGDGQQQFANPTDIAIDSHQNVFVADCWNNRVQVFNSEGTFQYQIKQRGPEMEELHFPVSVCIDRDDNVYVQWNLR